MKKVHISRYSKKGDILVNAIGLIDAENKVMYIPKVSQKGTNYIDVVYFDTYHAGIVSVYGETEDGKQYMVVYYTHEVTAKSSI